MFLHKPLLLNYLSTSLRTALLLFLPYQILEYTFHILIVFRDGEFIQRYEIQLGSR